MLKPEKALVDVEPIMLQVSALNPKLAEACAGIVGVHGGSG